jgi:DNA-binding response OmpR family regulator
MEQIHVLLVEDSDDDALIFARAVRKRSAPIVVYRATDVTGAREFLSTRRPDLIALDCHLPGIGGLEILRELRSNASLQRVPVVMMSGTNSDGDVAQAYANGANSFLMKPTGFDEYQKRVLSLLEYWLETNCTSIPDIRSRAVAG